MRSDANLRLRECQPLPRFGSSPANVWARYHHARTSVRPAHFEASLGAGSTGASSNPELHSRAFSRTVNASAVTGVRCSYPVFSCSARHRMVLPSKSMSGQRRWRMAPIRCPVSCASTSATWKRQSTFRDTPSSNWYSSSDRTTRVGFFAVGAFKPLRGFESRSRSPCSSLDLPAQLKTARRNFRSYSIVRSDTGLPLGPILPARLALMNRSQSRRDSVAGFRSGPKNWRNIFVAARSDLCDASALVGVTSSTVDFKKLSQRERLGLLMAVRLRLCEPCGELVRLPLRAPPVAVFQRPGEPSTVLAPLNLV